MRLKGRMGLLSQILMVMGGCAGGEVSRQRSPAVCSTHVVRRDMIVCALQTRPGLQSSVRTPRIIHRLVFLLGMRAPLITTNRLLS